MSKFELPANFPKARRGSVILKQVIQGTSITDGGIILADAAENVQRPNVGIIYATGEGVGEDLAPGMKVYYNQYANLELHINGRPYFMMHDADIYCILDDENRVANIIKPKDEVRRGKKITQQAGMVKRLAVKSANDKDKREETYKKIIKKK